MAAMRERPDTSMLAVLTQCCWPMCRKNSTFCTLVPLMGKHKGFATWSNRWWRTRYLPCFINFFNCVTTKETIIFHIIIVVQDRWLGV